MKGLDGEVALATRPGTVHADKEAPQRAGVAPEGKATAEKPRASEEIVIEEISIDGMCGVY